MQGQEGREDGQGQEGQRGREANFGRRGGRNGQEEEKGGGFWYLASLCSPLRTVGTGNPSSLGRARHAATRGAAARRVARAVASSLNQVSPLRNRIVAQANGERSVSHQIRGGGREERPREAGAGGGGGGGAAAAAAAAAGISAGAPPPPLTPRPTVRWMPRGALLREDPCCPGGTWSRAGASGRRLPMSPPRGCRECRERSSRAWLGATRTLGPQEGSRRWRQCPPCPPRKAETSSPGTSAASPRGSPSKLPPPPPRLPSWPPPRAPPPASPRACRRDRGRDACRGGRRLPSGGPGAAEAAEEGPCRRLPPTRPPWPAPVEGPRCSPKRRKQRKRVVSLRAAARAQSPSPRL